MKYQWPKKFEKLKKKRTNLIYYQIQIIFFFFDSFE